jgi:hypothetical protein
MEGGAMEEQGTGGGSMEQGQMQDGMGDEGEPMPSKGDEMQGKMPTEEKPTPQGGSMGLK